MNSRTWLNLALVVVVVGLGLFAYYQPGLEPPPTPVPLSELAPEQITRLHVERIDKPAITLVKEKGQWRITEPQALPADDGRLNSILRIVQEKSQSQHDIAKVDPAKLKLDAPRVRAQFNDLEIAFGDTDPINGRRYVQIGDTVHLITDLYYYNLDADLASFVSTRPLPSSAQIAALTLPEFSVTRDAQGNWQVAPEPSDLAADAVQQLLEHWRQANALWVRKYEPAPSQGSIAVRLDDTPDELRFEIVAREPELVLARPDIGMQYHFPAASADELLKPAPAPAEPAGEDTPAAPATSPAEAAAGDAAPVAPEPTVPEAP